MYARVFLIAAAAAAATYAQWDPGKLLNQELDASTDGKLKVAFDERVRSERRSGNSFGRDVDTDYALTRIRFGARYTPNDWLSIFGSGQDSRIPFFGVPGPNNVRDTIDLYEAYVDLFAKKKTGFAASFGRRVLNYGDSRLIGVPQWSNVARPFDGGRMQYRTGHNKFELLLVSPVKVRVDDYNNPNLGERIWGTYNSFSEIGRGSSVDVYALRHSQNKIGGWTGTGTLGTNSFGARIFGPTIHHFQYTVEAVGQTGHMGALGHRAFAWASTISRRWSSWSKPLDLTIEYKAASGTGRDAQRSGTFDQLAPANHDKFGHEDLFGWRNIHNVRLQATSTLTKIFALNLMYDNSWLFRKEDALYNGQGRAIVRSPNGTAGRHVGQEIDFYATFRRGPHLFGAGIGQFVKGEFIRNTTPGANPRYFYLFQQYSF